jgi:hypothetical protein
MKTYLILRILLALHLAGLVIMAGATVIDYVTFKTFWNFADNGDNQALGLLPLMSKYGAIVRAGAAILLLTGIGMWVMTAGALWEQLWFKVKMALVILLVLHGMFIGNKQGHKFREMVVANASDFVEHTIHIRGTLNSFYLIQLGLFFIIILLSVIKF